MKIKSEAPKRCEYQKWGKNTPPHGRWALECWGWGRQGRGWCWVLVPDRRGAIKRNNPICRDVVASIDNPS